MILSLAPMVRCVRERRCRMAEYQKDKKEVQEFLSHAKDIILKGNVQINNMPWKGKVNKTLTYMSETGITQRDMEKVVCELQTANYSYTADDNNQKFKNEQFWIFGIIKNMVDKDERLYVKLKIKMIKGEILLIMSFHPEEPEYKNGKLEFPYKV